MKLKDLVVGETYQMSTRPGTSGHRVLLLDKGRWSNASDWIRWQGEKMASWPERPDARSLNYGKPAHRVAVAIEMPRTEHIKVDPRTGETFEGMWRQSFGYALGLTSLWVPYAATLTSLRRPWADLAPEDQARNLHYGMTMEELLARADADAEKQRADSAERARRAEIDRRQAEQRERERAANDEFWEQRLQPALVDLGLTGEEVRRHYGDGKVTIDAEALARVLARRDP